MVERQRKYNVIAECQPGPQSLLITCPCFEVFFGGARGGGKTFGMLLEWLSHQDEWGDKASGIMVRRTFKQLEDTIKAAKALFIPLGAKWTNSVDKYATFVFPNGSEIRFRHLENDEDAENYQGHSYTRLYIEELGNFPRPEPIFKLVATLRSPYGVPCGFRATGNPGGPGHQWVKSRYITPAPLGYKVLKETYANPWTGETIIRDRVYIPSRITDNKFLGNDYIANLHMVGSPKLVRAWLEGDWSVVDGAFFDNFDMNRHVIRPIPLSAKWLRFRAGDWGSAKPFAFGWFVSVSDPVQIHLTDGRPHIIPRGALIMYREWYGCQKDKYDTGLKLTVEQAADGIIAREIEEPKDLNGKSGIKYGVLDPACFADTGGPSIAERFGDKRIYWNRADNARVGRNGRLGGWDMIRHRLDGESGSPMIYIFSTCTDTIRTLPELQHDDKHPEDIDTESEDHAADMLRYACMSRPWVKKDRTEELPPYTGAVPISTPYGPGGQVMVNLDKLFKEEERMERRRPIGRL
jgi:hypothetical protein